jgi:hypothetical protein
MFYTSAVAINVESVCETQTDHITTWVRAFTPQGLSTRI